jgi:hypothetical protein
LQFYYNFTIWEITMEQGSSLMAWTASKRRQKTSAYSTVAMLDYFESSRRVY